MADRTAPQPETSAALAALMPPQPDREGWIEWDGVTLPDLPGPTWIRFVTGAEVLVDRPRPQFWRPTSVVAYRPVSPAQEVEPSAPVAFDQEWPTRFWRQFAEGDGRAARSITRTDARAIFARITALEAAHAAKTKEAGAYHDWANQAARDLIDAKAKAAALEAENTELKRRLEDVPARMEADRADAASKAQEIYILATTARDALKAENAALRGREADRRRARPLDDWQDDHGPVLWWVFPIEEAPFVGDPRGDDWPGYHTHWTPMLDCPVDPSTLLQGQEPAGTVGDGR